MDYVVHASADSNARIERRFAMSILFEPMLEPLQSAFGEYAGIAEQQFADALSRIAERSDG